MIGKVFRKFPKTFWTANTVELFERWAWYGIFSVFSLYLVNSTETGALGFSQIEKGRILGIGTMILYFLPVITGSIADKIGYKKVLLISFTIYAIGFLLLNQFSSFYGIFFVYLILAIGGAFFKPIITATVSKTTDKESSSIGFGIFYMMVNIGAFIGPIFSSKLIPHGWHWVFYLSTFIVGINFILVLLFFKEPGRQKNTEKFTESLKTIFNNIFIAMKDLKFVLFLLLISGFWTMYFQLFFTLPVFVEQWVDTSVVYDALHSLLPWIAQSIGTAQGTIRAEIMINFDAFCIVTLQILVSSFVMRLRPIHSMMGGILLSSIGMGLTLTTQNGLYFLVFLFFFAIGEMASSPKTNEYVGKIAPRDKVALYMGCNFIPLALGNFFAGFISGDVYQNMSDKLVLLQKEVAARKLSIPETSETFTKTDYFAKFQELTGMNHQDITALLWDKYEPSQIWIVITSIGVASSIGLFLYDKLLFSGKKKTRLR